MIRTYKIRLSPTPEQEALMWQHIGASRWIWNYMLDLQEKRYSNGEKHLSAFAMNYLLTQVKQQYEYSWLYKISNATLQRTCADLAVAYERFFKKTSKHPRLKTRKKSKPSFPIKGDIGAIWFSDSFVQIQKIGHVTYQTNYTIPQGRTQKFSNPRIQYTPNGKWILTVGVERENQAFELTNKPMGIDLGVKELAVVSFDDQQLVFHNINKSKRIRQAERRLTHLQRNVSRKYEHAKKRSKGYEKTSNIVKAESKVKKAQYVLANIRANYRHQVTHALVSMLPNRVVMEDLNVSGMMKNQHLSKAIAQQGFNDLIFQMQYKCEEQGIEFVKVPRFYPSSKTCSCCGIIKQDLKLSDRTYTCSACGATLDRDYNAAINLARYAA